MCQPRNTSCLCSCLDSLAAIAARYPPVLGSATGPSQEWVPPWRSRARGLRSDWRHRSAPRRTGRFRTWTTWLRRAPTGERDRSWQRRKLHVAWRFRLPRPGESGGFTATPVVVRRGRLPPGHVETSSPSTRRRQACSGGAVLLRSEPGAERARRQRAVGSTARPPRTRSLSTPATGKMHLEPPARHARAHPVIDVAPQRRRRHRLH